MIVLKVAAYRELMLRQRINDAARAVMPASTNAAVTGGTVNRVRAGMQALPSAETQLGVRPRIIGSGAALAKIPGEGGAVARESGVMLIAGRAYATGGGTVPPSEIYFVKGAKADHAGPWLYEAENVRRGPYAS